MIVLYLIQLFAGTLILQTIFGFILTLIQRSIIQSNFKLWLFLVSIFTITLYCIIAYYYSECINIYLTKHTTKYLVHILSFLLLTFMLFGPAKYAEIKEQYWLVIISGNVGIVFFIFLRIFPAMGHSIFGWLPVFIFT